MLKCSCLTDQLCFVCRVFFTFLLNAFDCDYVRQINRLSPSYCRDAAVVTVGDSLTSAFGGVVIFSFIGSMANTLNVPVKDVATKGSSTL